MRAITTKCLVFSVVCAATWTMGCDDKETTAVIVNGYKAAGDGGFDSTKSIAVYKGWWLVTLFNDPVAAGADSDPQRVVSGNDAAYVILAPGWDPTSETPPTVLIPAKTSGPIHVEKGDVLTIAVDDAHVTGNCAAGHPLAQADADFITQSIFPGDFEGRTYDAATCTLTASADDAGADANVLPDASDDAD